MNKSQLTTELKASNAKGFNSIVNGLGLMPGKYIFTTAPAEDIFGIKEVVGKDDRKWALTMVAGTLKGAEESNASVNNSYGIGDTDRQFVVTADTCLQLKPDQSYDVVINDKFKVGSITPRVAVASTELLEVGA